MSSIDLIKAALNVGNGVASPTRYETFIRFPAAIAQAFLDMALLNITTEMTEIPGRQIATTPQIIYGVARKMPYGVVYNDLPMTFICTNDMKARTIFDQWHSAITDPTNNYFNYYDDYVGEIYIFKKDEQNNRPYFVVLEEAYPITIEAQQLDAGATDQYLRLNVQIAYRRWRNLGDLISGSSAFGFNPGQVFDDGGKLSPFPGIPGKLAPVSPKGKF